MPTPTYLFYDLETTGLNPAFDQILQFAAIRMDLEFNEIERFNIRVALSPDVIPNPNALLVNHISAAQLSVGMSEYEAIKKIFEIVNLPGTISLGYNTLGFDDEFLRFSFFRHLLPPYWHQYKNNCHRMDIYPMVLLAHHLQLNLLRWPEIAGKKSFKLEHLVLENNLSSGQSHDALVDVLDTIAIAKKLKSDVVFWEKAVAFFNKTTDAHAISSCTTRCRIGTDLYTQGFLMVSQPSSPLIPVLYLGKHADHKNQSRWLKLDHVDFSECSRDDFLKQIEVIRKKEGEAPFFFSYNEAHLFPKLNELNRSLVENNLQFLQNNPVFFAEILEAVLHRGYAMQERYDANAALYKLSFPTQNEESLFRKFHLVERDRKQEVLLAFSRPVYRALAIRLLGRHMPDSLSGEVKTDYENYIRYVFSVTPDNALVDHRSEKKLTLTEALAEIEKLLLSKTAPREQEMLNALKTWYQNQGASRVAQREVVSQTGFFAGLSQHDARANVHAEMVNQSEVHYA